MEILKRIRLLLEISGLLLDEEFKERKWNRTINIALTTPFIVLLYGLLLYLTKEAKSVIDFTESVYSIAVYLLLTGYYAVFIAKKVELNQVIIDLDQQVNTRKKQKHLYTFRRYLFVTCVSFHLQ